MKIYRINNYSREPELVLQAVGFTRVELENQEFRDTRRTKLIKVFFLFVCN